MANETVLRCLRRSAKTRSTAASFAMDAQPHDSWQNKRPEEREFYLRLAVKGIVQWISVGF
jgi:hypothetical protein